jgi:CRISPR-associated protein Csb2
VFANAPKPLFRPVRYGRRTATLLLDVLDARDERFPYGVSLRRVTAMVEIVRNEAARRLLDAYPEHRDDVERVVVGRKADGRDGGPIEDRVRIIPLPSIGHEDADRAIRRLAVELPGGSSLSGEDLAWAFDGLTPMDPETGELGPFVLVRAEERRMLRRYAAAARRFRSITPVVLPVAAARRRIEPKRRGQEAKGAAERHHEERRAHAAVLTAIRHAGVVAGVELVHVQREPLERRGMRAEAFADGTRFPKERLWHVELAFDRQIEGPLVIGDGRFLGLGVMAPIVSQEGVYAFAVTSGLEHGVEPTGVARALRRAVMARVQEEVGARTSLPSYFTGHERDGSSTRNGSHLAFAFDAASARLLVFAPHLLEHREPGANERSHLAVLARALDEFSELRAGNAGLLSLRHVPVDASRDPVFALSRCWRTTTPYQVTRHAKRVGPAEALAVDVRAECRRSGLPTPTVSAKHSRGVPGRGLTGELELEFASAVNGPILLGRNRYFGGGLFVAAGASLAPPP